MQQKIKLFPYQLTTNQKNIYTRSPHCKYHLIQPNKILLNLLLYKMKNIFLKYFLQNKKKPIFQYFNSIRFK